MFHSKVRPETLLKTDSVKDFENKFQANYKVDLITLVVAKILPSPTYWKCFYFVEYFHMQPFRRTLEKKSGKTSSNFQRNTRTGFFSFFIPKQQPCLQINFSKIVFFRFHPIAIRCAGNKAGQNSSLLYL